MAKPLSPGISDTPWRHVANDDRGGLASLADFRRRFSLESATRRMLFAVNISAGASIRSVELAARDNVGAERRPLHAVKKVA